ncbi:beta-galactosidase [Microbacterium terricola]|uniref:beta-galactosidase n=1 Tax=Microbacterium terricola TaxID=344163 RepID=A0ABM8E3E1_9MICO|nr:beta-galactosidase [Microbacterium terricola]UYK40011.1 beta-galactosidase [Microbacterium terricola]BDV32299.1 beta-galactosidase [Microbacterium terricola]
MSATTRRPTADLLFGVAYYPEYHQSDRTAKDLDLMAAAGINVIRVGESVWSTWEPRDAEFDLEWLAPVLDGAHERGIRVILGTPTYAVPPWLQTAHPEIAAERRTGERIPWGARQEVDYTHPVFRFHAERVIRRIIERHAEHPAVIGYQVDNEPGLELLHNQGVFEGFVASLREQYGDVDTLNREWGLTYWSHRLGDWTELWRPDGNTFPQYDLAWRRYQAQVTTDFIAWQAEIVREYATDDQFVTTCLQYPRRALDDRSVFEALDVASGNPYYGMQDQLDASKDLEALNYWTTSGVAGLFRQADRMYSSRQQRYLVTETNAQAIDASENNFPPYPGQLRQAAFALISRGAEMIEYWHWHSLPYGAETYWGGVLPHSLEPGRIYREVSEIGRDLAALGARLDGYVPDADAVVLWSNPSRYALQFMPPLARDGKPDDESYERIFDAFYRGVLDAGGQARIMHVEQALALGAAELARRYPVLIAAAVYITSDADITLLRDYAAAGGHLLLGPRTAYADELARARIAVAPPGLADAAGVRYEEFSNLQHDITVTTDHGASDGSAHARLWVDGLIPTDADILATYAHPRFSAFAAVTTHVHGAGRITVVGTVPDRELARTVAAEAIPTHTPAVRIPAGSSVTMSSGTAGAHRYAFLFNWGQDRQQVGLATDAEDAIGGVVVAAGTTIDLAPWGTRILRFAAEGEAR